MNKALVLEPQRQSRKLIVNALRKQGIQVRAFDSPTDVAGKFRDYMADLVLVDIRTPGTSGMKLLQRIKEQAPEAKIILLSSGEPTKSERSLIHAYDFLMKPIDRNKLISHVKELIRKKQQSKRAFPSNTLTEHMLADLHDPATGRLDAKLIADYLAIPLSAFATTLDKSVAALHKNPDATSIQEVLSPIARSIAVLSRLLGTKENVRAWVNSPHPDLGNQTPLNLILEGKAVAVVDMLEAVLAGQAS